MPSMTTAQRLAIAAPKNGLQVYDTDLLDYYFFNGSKWDCVSTRAGTVQYFANATPPSGYLECNGQMVSRTQYPELFAALGTLYGSGDGSTTFRLPDLRGEFLRGWSSGSSVDNGRVLGSQQSAAFANHTHFEAVRFAALNGGSIPVLVQPGFQQSVVSDAQNATLATSGSSTETRPRNVALLVCIKY